MAGKSCHPVGVHLLLVFLPYPRAVGFPVLSRLQPWIRLIQTTCCPLSLLKIWYPTMSSSLYVFRFHSAATRFNYFPETTQSRRHQRLRHSDTRCNACGLIFFTQDEETNHLVSRRPDLIGQLSSYELCDLARTLLRNFDHFFSFLGPALRNELGRTMSF